MNCLRLQLTLLVEEVQRVVEEVRAQPAMVGVMEELEAVEQLATHTGSALRVSGWGVMWAGVIGSSSGHTHG